MRNKECLETLSFIRGFIAEKGYAPTLREIGRGRYMAHTTVYKHVLKLEDLGLILRDEGIARSIRIRN